MSVDSNQNQLLIETWCLKQCIYQLYCLWRL